MIARRIYIKTDGSHVQRHASIYLECTHTHAHSILWCLQLRTQPAHHQPCESFLSKMARYLSRLAFRAQSRTPLEQPVEAIWGSVSTAAAAPVADSVRVNNVDSHAQWRCASGVALHTKTEALKTLAGPAALIMWLVVGLSKRWARLFSSESLQKTKSADTSSMLFFDFFQ